MSTPEDRVARAERLRRVEALYLEILARPAPERFTALAAACGSDSDLRAEVQSLLDQPHSAAGVLESQALEMTSRPVSGTDSLLTGRRLGDFELEGRVGVGGMGEVYRARDTRLGRTVAIKILPRAFVSNPDRLARFQQEARILAALDHPYICTLYDVGECQGISFLVMQYLEGETAADRLRRGPIPIAEAVKYATQIADALHAAHRAGFTHRDLKPANVVLTKNGAKVVDFGLAKLRGLSGPISMSDMVRMDTRTGKGAITGTLHYMSPEQVEGREADTRSDIWAFGVTLFEMITGRRPFEGDLPATVIGSILKDTPPPISATQVMSPPALDRLVSTCLERDPDERWQTAGDVKRQLRWILGTDSVSLSSSLPPTPRARAFPWLAVGLAAALLGVAPWAVLYWTKPTSAAPVTRFEVSPPTDATFAIANANVSATQFAISPDGRHIVAVATPIGGRPTLWVRSLDSVQGRLLPGTDDAAYPFWSPDSQSVGFFAQGKLKRTGVSNGLPFALADASVVPRGGSWSRDGIIVFAPDATTGLMKVPEGGGPVMPAIVLHPGETSHRWPFFLPDGRHLLVSVRGERRGIYLGSLDGAKWEYLVDSNFNAVHTAGYLLTLRDGSLMAHEFDERSLETTGKPIQVAEAVGGSSALLAAVSVSAQGHLAYANGLSSSPGQLTWFDRKGKRLGTVAEVGYYVDFRFSPDGRRLAVSKVNSTTSSTDIWLMDVAREVPIMFTSSPMSDVSAVWSADGDGIVFRSDRLGLSQIFEKTTRGGAEEERLLSPTEAWFPTDLSGDGRFILYHKPRSTFDLMLIPREADGAPVPFAESASFNESGGRFSPDGRFVAYTSDESESGRPEVYVKSYPSGSRWRVTTNGGAEPRWSPDGTELFYLAAEGTMMVAAVTGTTTFESGTPRRLFQVRVPVLGSPYRSNYEVVDGPRFLINAVAEGARTSPITVVLNWTAELTKK